MCLTCRRQLLAKIRSHVVRIKPVGDLISSIRYWINGVLVYRWRNWRLSTAISSLLISAYLPKRERRTPVSFECRRLRTAIAIHRCIWFDRTMNCGFRIQISYVPLLSNVQKQLILHISISNGFNCHCSSRTNYFGTIVWSTYTMISELL